MSATKITGESEILAIAMLDISVFCKLISAQLPEPSKTITS